MAQVSSESPLPVSVVTTVKYEALTIGRLLASLVEQTLPADEILVVDAGSDDGTDDVVAGFAARGLPVRMVVVDGANRSQGRNAGIRMARNDILALTDGGCELDPRWLEEITSPLAGGQAEVSAGFYRAAPRSDFEKLVAALTVPQERDVNPATFIPSGRSVAFLRAAWEKVGGYPGCEPFNEDTPFGLALRRAGCKFAFCPKAIANWRPRSSLVALYRQYYAFARGDARCGLFFAHYWKAPIALALVLLSFWWRPALAVLAIGFLVLAVRKLVRAKQRAGTASPLVLPIWLTLEFAHALGFARGLWDRIARKVRR